MNTQGEKQKKKNKLWQRFPIVVAQLKAALFRVAFVVVVAARHLLSNIAVPFVVAAAAAVIGSALFSILLTNLLAGKTVSHRCATTAKAAKTKDSGNKLAMCATLAPHMCRTHSGLLPLLTTFPNTLTHTHTHTHSRKVP